MAQESRNTIGQRVDEEKRAIVGYAALYDSPSADIGFIEVIKRGAFTEALEEVRDGHPVFAFWNHNTDFVLGSTRNGSLKLEEDNLGLSFSLQTNCMSEQQIEAVRSEIMKMSFGFRVRDGAEEWSRLEGKDWRTVSSVELFEVSPTAIPAYPDTSAALRSLESAREERAVKERKFHDARGYFSRKLRLAKR